MSHELITRVCAQLTQYHQLLDEISGADLSDMKNTEGRKKIAKLRKALSAGRKKTAEANKAGLRVNLDTTKEPRKKRVSSEEEDEPNKRPREMDVEFGSPEFIDDLKTRPFDGSHDIDTFLEKMMAISGSARKSILTVGLSLVMHGVVATSAEEYTKSFDSYKQSKLVRKALSLPVEDISNLTTEDLVDIYIGTSPSKGGDPIEVRTLTGLFQHVQQSLGSLRFIINCICKIQISP
ncbi:hypothetical protein FRC12_025220 [Ceratobasidium sp. 428]|nr:hypothetical protein FRC12_025220 [Ceratobasidium sp. 428]